MKTRISLLKRESDWERLHFIKIYSDGKSEVTSEIRLIKLAELPEDC